MKSIINISVVALGIGIGIVFPLWLTVIGCTDIKPSQSFLLREGYTIVSYEGYDWFNCGRSDIYRHKFSVVNPKQEKETVVVCSSLFGASIIKTFR
jgi:hypothetical protein